MIKDLREQAAAGAPLQMELIEKLLGDELADAVIAMKSVPDVFSTEALTQYSHVNFLKVFEDKCPTLIKLIIGAVLHALSKLAKAGPGRPANDGAHADVVNVLPMAKDDPRRARMLAFIMASFCSFLMGRSFQWAGLRESWKGMNVCSTTKK